MTSRSTSRFAKAIDPCVKHESTLDVSNGEALT